MDELADDIAAFRQGGARDGESDGPQPDCSKCSVCGRSKDEVHIRFDGLCTTCHNRIRYHTDPEFRSRSIAASADYHKRNREKANAANRKYQAKQRQKKKEIES